MPKFKNIELIPGKFYVVDRFSGPVGGPYDTLDIADKDRKTMNIDEDCYCGECQIQGTTYIIGNERVAPQQEYSCETCGADCDEPSVTCDGCSEGND